MPGEGYLRVLDTLCDTNAIGIIVDTFTRFSPAVDPRFSYRGDDVVLKLERICGSMSYPQSVRVDQGLQFVSRDLDLWAYQKSVVLDF